MQWIAAPYSVGSFFAFSSAVSIFIPLSFYFHHFWNPELGQFPNFRLNCFLFHYSLSFTLYPTLFIMYSDTKNQHRLEFADQHHATVCKQNCPFFFHSSSSHRLLPRFSRANRRSSTIIFAELDTVSKAEPFNVSIVGALSLLHVTTGSMHVQEVLCTIHDCNFDAKLLSPQNRLVQERHDTARSVVLQ